MSMAVMNDSTTSADHGAIDTYDAFTPGDAHTPRSHTGAIYRGLIGLCRGHMCRGHVGSCRGHI